MAQNFSTNSTQITDITGDTASVDALSNQLNIQEPTVRDLLQQRSLLLQQISDNLDNLLQPKTTSAPNLSVNIPQDNIVNVQRQDITVVGTLFNATVLPNMISGSYVEIATDGKSIVTAQTSPSAIGATNTFSFEITVDGINWYQPQAGFIPAIESALSASVSSSGSVVVYIPCAGYAKVRFVATTLNEPISVTLLASTSVPLNALLTMGSYMTIPNVNITSLAFPQILNPYGNVNTAGTLTQTVTEELKSITITSQTTGNILYGLNTYNPNDFTIYLIFYVATSILNISSSPSFFIPVPPGVFILTPGYYGLYYAGVGNYLFVAASMSNDFYVPVPLGLNTTFYTI